MLNVCTMSTNNIFFHENTQDKIASANDVHTTKTVTLTMVHWIVLILVINVAIAGIYLYICSHYTSDNLFVLDESDKANIQEILSTIQLYKQRAGSHTSIEEQEALMEDISNLAWVLNEDIYYMKCLRHQVFTDNYLPTITKDNNIKYILQLSEQYTKMLNELHSMLNALESIRPY